MLSSGFAMLPGLLEILAFGSATFLVVFALVNHFAARVTQSPIARLAAHTGSVACVGALVALGFELVEHDRPALVLIAICLVGLATARLAFVRSRRHSPSRARSDQSGRPRGTADPPRPGSVTTQLRPYVAH